jgi:predicted transposase YbfD/YdcC
LNLLVLGFAAGLTTLRRIEELSRDLRRGARRTLRLKRAVSDTTLYLLLGSQRLAGFRRTLVAQVKALWRSKLISNDLFRLGVLSFDGKSVWTSPWKTMEGAKESVTEDGVVHSSLAMLNAVLVSSSARPCLDLQLIREKSGESPAFREMARRVGNAYSGLFDVVTGDAGLMCRENAALIRGLNKHYVFTVKGNQQKLFALAEDGFARTGTPVRVTTTERRSGATITRFLHTLTVSDAPVGVYGAEELWRVEQVTQHDSGKSTVEVRFFISSLPPRTLSPTEKLQLVRLHWGIENNRHWTLDAIFEEDDRQPCQLTRTAVEVTCWLRALAYNLVATRRSQAKLRDGRPQPWRRTMQLLRDMLVAPSEEALSVTLA